MTWLPSVTCPSAITTTSPSLRTQSTVVACAAELEKVREVLDAAAPRDVAASNAHVASCFAALLNIAVRGRRICEAST